MFIDRVAELKAVKDGHIWRTKTDYPQMNRTGDMAAELSNILSGDQNAIMNSDNYLIVE